MPQNNAVKFKCIVRPVNFAVQFSDQQQIYSIPLKIGSCARDRKGTRIANKRKLK